jgi:SAM-dependent methyltransferase
VRWLTGYAKNKVRFDQLYRQALAGVPPWEKVLDLGCGVGLLGMLLEARGLGNETHGIEWDPSKARFAQRLTGGGSSSLVVCGDLFNEPWPDCSVVTVLDVLHYLTPELQRKLIFRIGEHLPKGGRVLIRIMDGRAAGLATLTRLLERMAVLVGWNQAACVHWRPLSAVHTDLGEAGLVILPATGGTAQPSGNQLLTYGKAGLVPDPGLASADTGHPSN